MTAPDLDACFCALSETPLSEYNQHTGHTPLKGLLSEVAEDIHFLFCRVNHKIFAEIEYLVQGEPMRPF